MVGVIEGIVLEVVEREKKGVKEKVARLFQPGEKGTVDIVLSGQDVCQGEKVSFKCRLIPWANDRGSAFIACKIVGD